MTIRSTRSVPLVTPHVLNHHTSDGRVIHAPAAVATRKRGGVPINDMKIQQDVMHRLFEYLGDHAWEYDQPKAGNLPHLKGKLLAAYKFAIVDYPKLPYSTVRYWFHHYLAFGETKARTLWKNKKKWASLKRRRHYMRLRHSKTFTAGDINALKQLIENKPQLYLDEIQKQMRQQRGKHWHVSLLWKELHRQNYSLKVAVNRAIQQNEHERYLYRERLKLFLHKPGM